MTGKRFTQVLHCGHSVPAALLLRVPSAEIEVAFAVLVPLRRSFSV